MHLVILSFLILTFESAIHTQFDRVRSNRAQAKIRPPSGWDFFNTFECLAGEGDDSYLGSFLKDAFVEHLLINELGRWDTRHSRKLGLYPIERAARRATGICRRYREKYEEELNLDTPAYEAFFQKIADFAYTFWCLGHIKNDKLCASELKQAMKVKKLTAIPKAEWEGLWRKNCQMEGFFQDGYRDTEDPRWYDEKYDARCRKYRTRNMVNLLSAPGSKAASSKDKETASQGADGGKGSSTDDGGSSEVGSGGDNAVNEKNHPVAFAPSSAQASTWSWIPEGISIAGSVLGALSTAGYSLWRLGKTVDGAQRVGA